jgi:RNA polymerase sigma factor (sigma-70 family)
VAAPSLVDTVDQRDLVERAGRGDHDAFTLLVRGSIARLDAAARLILRDPELARDAVQDALVGAWRDLPGLRDPDRFDAWIHRLTVHSCLDILRRRRRRPMEVELSTRDPIGSTDIASFIADRDLLDRALRRLEPEWRAVVVVHYFLGLPLPETAVALGIPIGTVKSRLHRSLAMMRGEISGLPDEAAAELARGQYA